MKSVFFYLLIILFICSCHSAVTKNTHNRRFDLINDLLLLQNDCKTDVDDLHSIAAFATLLADDKYKDIHHHAVAGTYGIQDGLYVPANELFALAFENNWSDAHDDKQKAIDEVKDKVVSTLQNHGDIWIAEAGQSDFSATLLNVVQDAVPNLSIADRIHIVQHSEWNEGATSPEALSFVKATVDYLKIPDGNALDNGTPGFRTPKFAYVNQFKESQKLSAIWQLAIDLSNQFNGADGRYLNEAIAAGGLDFSDFAEVCWILEIEDIANTEDFFELFGQ